MMLILFTLAAALATPVLTPSQIGRVLRDAAERPPATELTPDLDVPFEAADLKNPNDWKRQFFDVVVVVDKAADVQSAWVYVDGKLDRKVDVSTGREKVEKADPNGDPHKPVRDTVSQTHTGYFTPSLLAIDYVSTLYEDSEMPWSVFYNLDQGEATHRAPLGTEKALGKRASGGCVRMNEKDAHDVFWLTRMSGGPFSEEELANAQFKRESNEVIKKGRKPFEEAPMIPKFDLLGNLERDEDGNLIMREGYRALFVILNSEI